MEGTNMRLGTLAAFSFKAPTNFPKSRTGALVFVGTRVFGSDWHICWGGSDGLVIYTIIA